MLKGIVRFVGVTLLLCSATFSGAQDSASSVASPAPSDLPESNSAAVPAPVISAAPSADDNAALLQPFLFSYNFSSVSRAATDTEPLAGSSSSLARPDPLVHNEAKPPRVHWKPALWQSARFLLVMHAFRFATEPSTRAEIKGPFWGDYFDSVLGTDGWSDGDPKLVNYIGHPLEGAAAGFIFIQNDDKGRSLEFGKSSAYWKSRAKAMAWSAVFSVQFELGPISEASLGNVGKDTGPKGQTYMGAVDLVVTPLMGLGWIVAEDALDKYAIKGVERHTDSRVVRAFARGLLNPSRSFANMMRGKLPWHRDNRSLSGTIAEQVSDRPQAAPQRAVPAAPSGRGTVGARSGH